MLRRKRGADFDLSDSEDDAEARRRRKRREFAKMRKALLENENVGKIAEDPKKMAFLRAIEDREDDEDLDFLEQPEESSQQIVIDIDSQGAPNSQSRADPESSNTALGKRKRPLAESAPDATNRPPAPARRTPATTKPSSLAEIRASVSFLVEEPDAVPIAPPSSPIASDNEPDENDENALPKITNTNNNDNNPFTSRRCRTTINPIIDRLSLKRTSSSTSSSSSNNLFFHSASTIISGGFKVPSLLRRATTSSSSAFPNNQDKN
ncbi:MAG: hypothetical protein Q9225_005076, partial [Loekoesia sp. 1 TL-2023]